MKLKKKMEEGRVGGSVGVGLLGGGGFRMDLNAMLGVGVMWSMGALNQE